MTKINYSQYINQKFGNIIIRDVASIRGRQHFVYNCDCGTKNKSAQTCDVLSGKIKTCGHCLVNNLMGTKIGKLKIVQPLSPNSHRLMCECDCGNTTIYTAGELNTGRIQSCGHCPVNQYIFEKDYVIGYTSKGDKFYFDLNDYKKVIKYQWRLHHSGYVVTSLPRDKNGKRKILSLHSLIFNDEDNIKNIKIDHINRNKCDNRKSNLRKVNNSLNGFNINRQSNNTSGKTGVSYNKNNNNYVSYICVDYNKIYLGSFKNFEDAVNARKEAEIKYFGELSDTKYNLEEGEVVSYD